MADRSLRRPQQPHPDFKALLAHLKERDAERDEKNEAQLGEVLGLVVRRLDAVDGTLEDFREEIVALKKADTESKAERASLLARLDEAISWQGEARDLIRIIGDQIKGKVDESDAATAETTIKTAAALAVSPVVVEKPFLQTVWGKLIAAGVGVGALGTIIEVFPKIARGWESFWRYLLSVGAPPPGS